LNDASTKGDVLTPPVKTCTRCGSVWPLTGEYWYVARPRGNHKSQGWQSHCRECWKDINRLNKIARKAKKLSSADHGLVGLLLPISAPGQSQAHALTVERRCAGSMKAD
jgi:Zn-finger nucleic acid-binding protein